MIKTRKNLEELTVMRAIAILTIIAAHLYIYTNFGTYQELLIHSSFYTVPIGLSLFFFVSGFLLYYHHNLIQSAKETLEFYYKRFKRIYPLYWIALLCLIPLILYTNGGVVTNYSTMGIGTYIAMFLGIQSLIFAKINLTHLWFVSVIILYYLLFPLIIYPKKLINMFSLSIITFLMAYVISLKFNVIDIRFFLYYWAFIIGIIICWFKYNKEHLFSKNYRDYIILLVLLPLLAIILGRYDLIYYSFIGIVVCLVLYALLNSLFENKGLNKKLTSNKVYAAIDGIALGSYANYLFHPIILLSLTFILNYYRINPFYHNLIMIFVFIPLVFVLSYYIQILEFKLIKNVIIFPKIKTKIKNILFS